MFNGVIALFFGTDNPSNTSIVYVVLFCLFLFAALMAFIWVIFAESLIKQFPLALLHK